MSQSTFGKKFTVTTWGESHGKALGTVVDGVPAGLFLTEADIQAYLDRRKPGQSRYTTARNEGDEVEILSGVFEGQTTGTPISNSMVELYTIQRYLQMSALEEQGLQHFDAWAANYGETVTAIELSPEGYTLTGR